MGGDGVKDVEFRTAHTRDTERAVEGVTACLGEIDRTKNCSNRRHTDTSSPIATWQCGLHWYQYGATGDLSCLQLRVDVDGLCQRKLRRLGVDPAIAERLSRD